MKLRSVSTIALRAVLWPLAFAALLYLALVLINRHDQPASPAAQRMDAMFRARTPVADADNGYLYLQGVGYIREHDAVLRKQSDSRAFRTIKRGCAALARSCQTLLEGSAKDIGSALDADPWTLARYRELIERNAWQRPMPMDPKNGFPEFLSAFIGQELLMLDTWNRARAGDASAVGAALAQDHRFWRMVLGSSDDLLCKMMARAALRRNLMWGNIVLAQLPRAKQEAAVPAQWRLPLSIQEKSLLPAMVGEYQFTSAMLDDLPAEAIRSEMPLAWLHWSAAAPLFLRQDSMNGWAEMVLANASSLDVDYRELPAALARLRGREAAPPGAWSMDELYNPFGKAMVRVGAFSWSHYGARLADLEGVRRGALLAIELRSAGVPPDRVPEYVAAAPLRNPYDGKPFGWDARSKSLIFTGLEPYERGRSELVY